MCPIKHDSGPEAVPKGIGSIDEELTVCGDMRAACDDGMNPTITALCVLAFEHAADDAFLPKDLPGCQLGTRGQTGEFGTGAGATG